MKELGVNTIRVYHVDANGQHDGCMKEMDNAGIYLLVDMDTFGTYIEAVSHHLETRCLVHACSCFFQSTLYWNSTQYDRYSKVMDAFHNYNNVLGFFVGNENIAKQGDSPAAPFLKAAARDLKAYRDKRGYRKIPVGYSAADIVQLRPMLQDYLTCGGNSSEIVDFFALNSYSWCDPSTFEKSSYNMLQEYAKDFPVPIFFSETGCNVPGPRLWDDQDAIFTQPMVNDWSGAIVYEWIQEENNYGLISYGPKVDPSQQGEHVADGFTRKGTPTPVNPDFGNLKNKWSSNRPTGVSKKDYDAKKVSTRPCPTSTIGGWWQVNGNVKIPAVDETVTAALSTKASATADASTKPSDSTGGGAQKTGSSDKKGDDSSASRDKRITAIGLSAAGVVLGFALFL